MQYSKIAEIIEAFDAQDENRITILDYSALAGCHVPFFPSDYSAVVLLNPDSNMASLVKPLREVYPANLQIKLLESDGVVRVVLLGALEGCGALALLIPALGQGTSFEAFHEIIAHLRAPEDGCPWDKEQTHLSLRKHLLEESYETLLAMDEQDPAKMCEEFGDLLLQIYLNAQIASESGEFNMSDVLKGINDKIVRRHPHVFGEVNVDGVTEVLSNWEKIKAGERKSQGNNEKGILDGLPAALPALTQAQEYQVRAARVGFDWPEIDGVLLKVNEEIEEVRDATNEAELTDEIGDLFFALVNLARWKKIDAESALRAASLKFKTRFKYVENRTRVMERNMQSMSVDELDGLWNDAKKQK